METSQAGPAAGYHHSEFVRFGRAVFVRFGRVVADECNAGDDAGKAQVKYSTMTRQSLFYMEAALEPLLARRESPSEPAGRLGNLGKFLRTVSRLPRRQQEHIVRVVSKVVESVLVLP